jgi:magnesium transporter
VLGALTLPAVWLVFGDARLAAAVGLSIVVAGALANSIGLFFPWILTRLRMDPAYGSGPVATVVQDTLTIVVYFVVLWMLGL